MNNKVSIGWTTIVSWVGGGLLILPATIEQIGNFLANESTKLSGAQKYLVIIGAAKLGIAAVFRYIQSLKIPGTSASTPEVSELEPASPSSSAGESARTPDGAAIAESS